MDDSEQMKQKAHLFTLRIWSVSKAESPLQWRSRLQNIQSGEVTFCRDWENLIAKIEDALLQEKYNSMATKEKLV